MLLFFFIKLSGITVCQELWFILTNSTISDFFFPNACNFLGENAGKNSFLWNGPIPRVTITEPEEIREIFTKFNDFQKPHKNPVAYLLVRGLVNLEGEKWAKHRQIINPAFHQDKLKVYFICTFHFFINLLAFKYLPMFSGIIF